MQFYLSNIRPKIALPKVTKITRQNWLLT